MRVAAVRLGKLVADARDISATHRKKNIRLWKPLPSIG
jgi:hypothetical protein